MRAILIHITIAVHSLVAFGLVGLLCEEARADWGGTVTGSAAVAEIDNVRSNSVEQYYTLYSSAQPTGTFRYSLSGLFRHLQNRTGNGPYSWTTETRPSASINWATQLWDLRGDGSYRIDRDELGTTKLTAGTASAYGQTTWTSLPRLFASSSWAKNVNDLDLIGYNTWTRSMSAGGNYSSHALYVNYEYSDLLTRNVDTNLDRTSRSHSGRADYTKALANQLVNVSTSYQVSSRLDKDNSTITGEPLSALQATGLYLADPSPDFDVLETAPALVDGLLDIAAGQDFDLVNGITHNFGLDFGQTVAIDHLHLYVDSLAALPLTWSIWQSSDNLNWSPVVTTIGAPFSTLFLRYEFAFSQTQTRFIKLTVSPQLLNTPVRVTELRGLIARTDLTSDERTTDQRGSARLQFQPAKWTSWDVSGDALRQSASLSALAREEDAAQTNLRFNPAKMVDLVTRYQWSRSNYTDTDNEFTYSTAAGAVLRSQWSRAISTSAMIDRTEEQDGKTRTRRGDRSRLELRTLVLPALRVTSQFSYSEDERFDTADKVFSRSINNNFEGEPTDRSQISVTYRYETRSARISAVRKYQSTVGGRLSYRLTETIHMVGNTTMTTDPAREDRAYDGIVSWTPTYKISLGGAFNRIESSQAENANQYSLQLVYNWSLRTELSASYSLNEREGDATSSSGRLSLFTRF